MKPIYIHYAGPSMKPLFKPGDLLTVESSAETDVVPGDVIVFVSGENENKRIVHRIIDVMPGRYVRTRGDNNPYPDSQPVPYDRILGRVVSAERKRQIIPIDGGSKGLSRARSRWVVRRLEAVAVRVIRPVYHRVCRSGFWQQWMQALIHPRVVVFKRTTGVEYHLFVGRRFAGRKLPNTSLWQIKRVFRPFIDESTLPE